MAQLGNVGHQVNIAATEMSESTQEAAQTIAQQETSQDNLKLSQEETVNPFAARFAQKDKKTENPDKIKKMMTEMKEEPHILPVAEIEDKAEQFHRKNEELDQNSLILLTKTLKPGSKKDEILAIVKQAFPDPSLADEALEFLLLTTKGDLNKEVQLAKDELNSDPNTKREITAGRNVTAQAQIASKNAEGRLGSPTDLRNLYKDVLHNNPKDSNALFEELSKKYADYNDIKKVSDYLLHAFGADMKAGGSMIEAPKLGALIQETRKLQAIIGIYRECRSDMKLMEKMFKQNGIEMPPQLNFNMMAKTFMSLVNERYPNADKVKASCTRLGI